MEVDYEYEFNLNEFELSSHENGIGLEFIPSNTATFYNLDDEPYRSFKLNPE